MKDSARLLEALGKVARSGGEEGTHEGGADASVGSFLGRAGLLEAGRQCPRLCSSGDWMEHTRTPKGRHCGDIASWGVGWESWGAGVSENDVSGVHSQPASLPCSEPCSDFPSCGE